MLLEASFITKHSVNSMDNTIKTSVIYILFKGR